ncbi:MAG: cytochrome c biogenesis protein ResB [Planctomycetota bacterium]
MSLSSTAHPSDFAPLDDARGKAAARSDATAHPVHATIDLHWGRIFCGVLVYILSAWVIDAILTRTLAVGAAVPARVIGASLLGVLWIAILATVGRVRAAVLHDMTTVQFAVVLMAVVATATIAGTFIIQGEEYAKYQTVYGSLFAGAILGLGLEDIFHSLWFGGLLLLLAVSLAVTIYRRRAWRLPTFGLFLSHFGIIVIVCGGMAGYIGGLKGRIDLNEGRAVAAMAVQSHGRDTGDEKNLGFAVRLDKFDIEKYPPSAKLFVYRQDGENYQAVTALDPAQLAAWTAVPGTNAEIRVPTATPVTMPTTNRAPAAGAAACPALVNLPKGAATAATAEHVLVIRGAQADAAPQRIAVTPGKIYPLDGNRGAVRVLQFLPDFTYDVQTHQANSRSDQPKNPALLVEILGPGGQPQAQQWLFANMPGFSMGHSAQPSVDAAPPLVYEFHPAGAQLAAGATANPSADAPASLLTLNLRENGVDRTVRVTPSKEDPVVLDGGRTLLAYTIENGEVKSYRSHVTILDDGRAVKSGEVAVNSPLSYGGYSIYQANYRADDPTYSGFEIVRDPGLPLIWIGMLMISLGVVYNYYIRPRVIGRMQHVA